ncbi:Stf0 family sulfotransferase [Azospirillum agricola]|uniref:Stf0 family sulfotransferase n=1 Tax=Azospirillum agricola TaxID=1720247 RepID=UPI000A0F28F5|nr:Stf0 family sulfotransferase [Azospirillum agricola]SMH33976.1 LPS sulfotransferase NodH [Azospirillum lipoferum]
MNERSIPDCHPHRLPPSSTAKPDVGMPSYDSYIICGTPRTGSTMLCDLLASTGVAGEPDSFFMQDIDPVWAEQLGLPSPEGRSKKDYCSAYLEAAISAGRGQSGIFGLRLMRRSFDDLMSMISQVHPGLPSDRDRLQAAFGNVLYIHLTREDKLSQAVSMVKAEQTGLWHIAADGSELERLSPPMDPAYDFARLRTKLDELNQYDAEWLAWFADQGLSPLKIAYETLSQQPASAVLAVCRQLGVQPPPLENIVPGVAKLADATNREWITRYQADAAAIR